MALVSPNTQEACKLPNNNVIPRWISNKLYKD